MGGLLKKMPITAITMLIGVIAISGLAIPGTAIAFSGYHSKDAIVASSLAYFSLNPKHSPLFIVPLATAGITAFYMFRLWFLTFAGKPRDEHVHEHAHESPAVMTVPLIVLAVFSVCVASGWPIWDAAASYLGHALAKSEPAAVEVQFLHDRHTAHDYHLAAGGLALLLALTGAGIAYRFFGRTQPTTETMYAAGGAGYRFRPAAHA